MKRARTGGPLWRKLLVLVAALVVAVLAVEVVLRVAGIRPPTLNSLSMFFQLDRNCGWVGIPRASGWFTSSSFQAWVSHDDHGFRSGELQEGIETDASFDGEVVWCVGDSQTWGWGVSDGETWVDWLQRASPPDQRYRNLGVSGTGTVQQYLLLQDLFARGWVPDRVVMLFTFNDVMENIQPAAGGRPYLERVGDHFELRDHPLAPTVQWQQRPWLRRHSLAWEYLHYLRIRGSVEQREQERVAAMRSVEQRTAPESLPPWREEQLRALRDAYRRTRDLCAEHGVRLAVAALFDDDLYEVRWACEPIGVPVLDGRAGLREHVDSGRSEPLFFASDPHFTPFAHRLVAATMATELAKLRAAERQ